MYAELQPMRQRRLSDNSSFSARPGQIDTAP
jgi:hypothetical protein